MAEQTEAAPQTGFEIEAERLAAMLDAGEVELIDVRQDYEHEAGRIPGARHIEINELTSSADSVPRDRPVVFFCRTGNRSAMAAEAFSQAGYDAHNLTGGLTAWAEQGRALEPKDGIVVGPRPV